MHTSVTFKNLDPSDALRDYASEKLDRFDKYLDNPAEANVVLTVEKHRHIAEINVAGDRLTINGKEETGDMYTSIDKVLDKLEKQIKKGKQKVRKRRDASRGKARLREEGAISALESDDEPLETTIRVETIDYKPMDVEEAVLQMELVDNQFMVFTNAKTGQVNVLYRRRGNNLGLIEPMM
ncbi:ribosome hibernation-promoting factor, HPF/YfiA family [Desulfatibacillum aliphaticivorans]|uniref:Ribosome hibernation promoting factor n=1 Tax=Desulfatibacillum aliphaticivorans TaxID=218208 RepID=B8F9W4_DESAL|nr:ribosome-associated translation inhibitor RaiA [Desulfatibacillum aliphaticivorans]ACL03060.1 sigma 54 modulation protein/ribosomal protein S30EA [Desulfatibacillum aliphaticivorans]